MTSAGASWLSIPRPSRSSPTAEVYAPEAIELPDSIGLKPGAEATRRPPALPPELEGGRTRVDQAVVESIPYESGSRPRVLGCPVGESHTRDPRLPGIPRAGPTSPPLTSAVQPSANPGPPSVGHPSARQALHRHAKPSIGTLTTAPASTRHAPPAASPRPSRGLATPLPRPRHSPPTARHKPPNGPPTSAPHASPARTPSARPSRTRTRSSPPGTTCTRG